MCRKPEVPWSELRNDVNCDDVRSSRFGAPELLLRTPLTPFVIVQVTGLQTLRTQSSAATRTKMER